MRGTIQTVIIGDRQYRTNGTKSHISGRLMSVEYQDDFGMWRRVKNVSRREEVLLMLEQKA